MNSLVVLFALAGAASASLLPLLAQPAHHPALVLDPHGRPLDTAEVINARALHLQAKHLEGHHYAPLVSVAAPLWNAHSIAAPWVGAHGHLLKKRSLAHSAVFHAPIVHAVAPSAVSHQSRVDVISSPAVVSHAVAAPAVVAHAAPIAVAHAAPIAVAVAAPAAVSHQSRVDVHSSPAVVAPSVVAAPAWGAHSVWGAPTAYSGYGLAAHGLAGHGHWLKKRSLFSGIWGHAHAPAAVSHQSRVDVISSPAVVAHHAVAPVVAHAAPLIAAPAAVSHVSRVDVHSSPAVVASIPLAHSVHAYPAHYSHHGLHAPLVHAW